jgi:hypothetical protein
MALPDSFRPRSNPLLHDAEFMGAETPRDQIWFVCRFLREDESEEQVAPVEIQRPTALKRVHGSRDAKMNPKNKSLRSRFNAQLH